MRTYAISCRPCLLSLDLIRALRRRDRRDGGGDDDDDEFMDITSGVSGSLFRSGGGGSDGGQEGETLSVGEGRNKGVFDERRGETGERDDDGRLVSEGGTLYHTTRMHTRRRKKGRHEGMDTPVAIMPAPGADREDQEGACQDDRQSNFLQALPHRRRGATWMELCFPLRIYFPQYPCPHPAHQRRSTGQDALGSRRVT
jgi:hypothetical protein